MKKILCYGDSNTYGFIPGTAGRYNKHERWSGILSEILSDFEIVEEGMNNRNGFFINPENEKLCGGKYLPVCLQKHKNIDICILALGTNDAQFFYNLNRENAKKGLQHLIDCILLANKDTKIIIIPPVKISTSILESYFAIQFNQTSIERIKEVFPIFEEIAKENNCLYFDFNEFVKPSELDGLHYNATSHKVIAEKLGKFIQETCQ